MYCRSLVAHGKNLARSRSPRFSLAAARSRSRLQVYLFHLNDLQPWDIKKNKWKNVLGIEQLYLCIIPMHSSSCSCCLNHQSTNIAYIYCKAPVGKQSNCTISNDQRSFQPLQPLLSQYLGKSSIPVCYFSMYWVINKQAIILTKWKGLCYCFTCMYNPRRLLHPTNTWSIIWNFCILMSWQLILVERKNQ